MSDHDDGARNKSADHGAQAGKKPAAIVIEAKALPVTGQLATPPGQSDVTATPDTAVNDAVSQPEARLPEAAPEPAAAPAAAPRKSRTGIVAAAVTGGIAGALIASAAYLLIGPAAAPQKDFAPALQSLEAKVAAAARPEALASLDKRLAAIEAQTQSLKSATDAALARAASALSAADAAKTASTSIVPAGSVSLAPLEERLAKAEALLAAPKAETRVTAERIEANAAGGNAASLAVAAQALVQAMAREAAFPNELAAVEAQGGDSASVAKLKPLAATGAPTLRGLNDKFAAVSAAILKSTSPALPEGTFDRLIGSASRLVRVRPAGEATGDDPLALVSRIETALARGAVPEALALWAKLPEPARNLSQGWAAEAKARSEANGAAQVILSQALAQLGKPKT